VSPDASWTFAPGAILLLVAVTGWYVARWRAVGESPLKLALFLAGIATTAIALLSPVDALGEQLFFMHMVQHLLLLDIAPILIILGLSRQILRPVTRRMLGVERRAGFLATPVFAITLYVATMWLWHIPALYDGALEHTGLHVLEHVVFSVAGGLYWWHILSPIRPRHRLLGLGPAGYMISTKVLVGLLGVFLTFSPDSFYAFYEDQPRSWGLSPGEDQAIGGAIMALEQMIVMGAVFAWLFVRMLGEADREDRRAERFPPAPAAERVPRVWALIDEDAGRTPLTRPQSREDLERQGVALHEGLALRIWDEHHGDVDAVARWDAEWGGYFAEHGPSRQPAAGQ
jgi:cytochrome c oxidase assembly factor CtaG